MRNELYHQGNGLTVERDKVEVYAELANQLFKNLFGFELGAHPEGNDRLGEFIDVWSSFEQGLIETAARHSMVGTRPPSVLDAAKFVSGAGMLSAAQVAEINSMRQLRNEVIHGKADHRQVLTPAVIARVRELAALFAE